MKLLISCAVFHPRKGGAESSFYDLARALSARGHEVTVLTRHFPGLPERESVDGFEIVREDVPIPYESLAPAQSAWLRLWPCLRRVDALLRRKKPETVCIGLLDMSALFLLALKPLRRFRLVTYLHGAEIRDLPRASKAFAWMVRRCMAASDAVVAVAPGLAAAAEAAYPEIRGKLSIIPNGVDVAQLRATAPEQRERPYILYLGRLDAEKNVNVIIEAYRNAGLGGKVDLVVAGTGGLEEDLRKQAASGAATGVVFLGAVERSRAFALVRGATLLVLASNIESHPIAAVEALVAGTPVLAPRVSGITEVVEDGRNGALFTAGDHKELAALLARYVSDPGALETLRRGVEASDTQQFELESLLPGHLEVLRSDQ